VLNTLITPPPHDPFGVFTVLAIVFFGLIGCAAGWCIQIMRQHLRPGISAIAAIVILFLALHLKAAVAPVDATLWLVALFGLLAVNLGFGAGRTRWRRGLSVALLGLGVAWLAVALYHRVPSHHYALGLEFIFLTMGWGLGLLLCPLTDTLLLVRPDAAKGALQPAPHTR
jgi:hypothetical protein